jgi:hypothetical protein
MRANGSGNDLSREAEQLRLQTWHEVVRFLATQTRLWRSHRGESPAFPLIDEG